MADSDNLDAQLEEVAKEFASKMAAYVKKRQLKGSFAEALGTVLDGVISEYIVPFRRAKSVKEIQRLKSGCINDVLKILLR